MGCEENTAVWRPQNEQEEFCAICNQGGTLFWTKENRWEHLSCPKEKTMSERYGDCKQCKGKGAVMHKTGVVSPEGCKEIVPEECPACGGTGFSGDAMEKVDTWTTCE